MKTETSMDYNGYIITSKALSFSFYYWIMALIKNWPGSGFSAHGQRNTRKSSSQWLNESARSNNWDGFFGKTIAGKIPTHYMAQM